MKHIKTVKKYIGRITIASTDSDADAKALYQFMKTPTQSDSPQIKFLKDELQTALQLTDAEFAVYLIERQS